MALEVHSYSRVNWPLEALLTTTSFLFFGLVGSQKLRSLEWLNGPVSPEGVVLSAAVNGVATTLCHYLGHTERSRSSLYQIALNITGFSLGALVTPYIASRMKQVGVLTHEITFRIAAFHLATKVAMLALFQMGRFFYDMFVFPGFDSFDQLTSEQLKDIVKQIRKRKNEWETWSLQKQLQLNGKLIGAGEDPLPVTSFEWKEKLSPAEMGVLDRMYGNSPQHAHRLYQLHVPPQDRLYKREEIPPIDPRKADVATLSDAQVQWHHKWVVAHPMLALSQSQISTFVSRFYALSLPPPSGRYLQELPLPGKRETLTPTQVSYFYLFYWKNQEWWQALSPEQQRTLNALFKDNHVTLPLRELQETEIAHLSGATLETYRKRYLQHPKKWNGISTRVQKEFNRVLLDRCLSPLPLKKWFCKF